MRGVLILCIALSSGVLRAQKQETVPPDSEVTRMSTAQLTVQADVDSAVVFVDSVRVGETPILVKNIQPGFHRLRVVHPDVTNWLTNSIFDSLQVKPGEDKALRYSFGRRFLILSIPSGAEVLVGDSSVGSTPYLLTMQGADSLASITLRKAGYDSAGVDLSDARRGMKTVTLKKLWVPNQRGEERDETEVTEKHGTFPVILAGAVTVGFGAAAAYFKIQADTKNDQYLLDGDGTVRSQIHTYDTASAVCLSIAEVGFGFLTYFLLSE